MAELSRIVVVMPAYNAEGTLRRTYDEVMAQGVVDHVILVDRTLDALHLAVASVEGLCIATADSGLFDAAVALGLEARLIRQIP